MNEQKPHLSIPFEKEEIKKCAYCGKELITVIPFQCKRCGEYYCIHHRLPEQHKCINLVEQQQPILESEVKLEDEDNISRKRKHKKHKKHKKKYTLVQTIRYKLRKLRIPPGFIISLILLFIMGGIHQVIKIDFLPTIFYIVEFVVMGYIIMWLIKKFDRISVHNNLRLFGLRMLSGIIGLIGCYFLFLFLFFGYPILINGILTNEWDTMLTFYQFMGLESFYGIFTFGLDFGLPMTGMIIYISFMAGLMIIGGYLFFKFQRKTGDFVWFGRI